MVPKNPSTSASQAKLDGSKSHAQSAKGKAEPSTRTSQCTESLKPSNTLGAYTSHAHEGAKKRKSVKTCPLNFKRRADSYIYVLYLSYTNIHTKYPISTLISIIIIIFHINKWLTCHPLINVCGVLRPPKMVIYDKL